MSAPAQLAVQQFPLAASESVVMEVLGSLRLEPGAVYSEPLACVLKRNGWTRIAALVRQGEGLREDTAAIESLKEQDPSLPIIYLSGGAAPPREAAIRRLGIHYFLTSPVDGEELRLVLDMLIRAATSTAQFERFFIR